MKTSYKINNLSELKTISTDIINLMKENKIFLFYGEMGSGKTTLIGEVCKGIGVDHHSSPTYGIINQYLSTNFGDIFHIDCYRFLKESEAINIGLMELLDENEYCFIEWPEKIQNLLPENCVKVYLNVKKNTREITLTI